MVPSGAPKGPVSAYRALLPEKSTKAAEPVIRVRQLAEGKRGIIWCVCLAGRKARCRQGMSLFEERRCAVFRKDRPEEHELRLGALPRKASTSIAR